MLTFIMNGENPNLLNRAIREIGQPNRLQIINEEQQSVSITIWYEDGDEATFDMPLETILHSLEIFNGDAAIIKSGGSQDEILDKVFDKLPDPGGQSKNLAPWTKGATFRLIEIWMGMAGYQILAQKPTPGAKEFALGQRVRPLSS